jgi:hypothetical protein
MSQIIHRCQSCGKPDYWRDGKTAGRTVNGKAPAADIARSCCRGRRWSDPELAPTFKDGRRVETVVRPGGTAGAIGSTTCDCDDCAAFYAGLVSA